jgi:hypothetical protein
MYEFPLLKTILLQQYPMIYVLILQIYTSIAIFLLNTTESSTDQYFYSSISTNFTKIYLYFYSNTGIQQHGSVVGS